MTFQHGCYILDVDAQYVIFSEILFFLSPEEAINKTSIITKDLYK